MKTYRLVEQLHTWQGEGCHAGRSIWLVRTFGCPVHCPWCDAANTWHPEKIPKHIEAYTPLQIAASAKAAAVDFVMLTGGEPAIHDLSPLTDALKTHGLAVHLETSGGFALRGDFDWVCVSPKRWKLPRDCVIAAADELKLIVDTPEAIEYWADTLNETLFEKKHVWLHPEHSRRGDPKILEAISAWVLRYGHPFRAGWQLHKLYGVDERPEANAEA